MYGFRIQHKFGFQFIEFPSEWGASIRRNWNSKPSCFQFIEFPSEWGAKEIRDDVTKKMVSNLLSSPASGEGSFVQCGGRDSIWVSNLLSSPASGEHHPAPRTPPQRTTGFQFIEFPSEWGGGARKPPSLLAKRFQFIEFPSEWGADSLSIFPLPSRSFQFIEFPSEWGVLSPKTRGNWCITFPIY